MSLREILAQLKISTPFAARTSTIFRGPLMASQIIPTPASEAGLGVIYPLLTTIRASKFAPRERNGPSLTGLAPDF